MSEIYTGRSKYRLGKPILTMAQLDRSKSNWFFLGTRVIHRNVLLCQNFGRVRHAMGHRYLHEAIRPADNPYTFYVYQVPAPDRATRDEAAPVIMAVECREVGLKFEVDFHFPNSLREVCAKKLTQSGVKEKKLNINLCYQSV